MNISDFKNFPFKIRSNRLNGIGATPSFIESIGDTVNKTVPSLVAVWRQEKIFKMNQERVKQGLPPLKYSDIAPSLDINIQGASQAGEEAAKTLQAVRYAAIGAAVIAGLAALYMFNKKR